MLMPKRFLFANIGLLYASFVVFLLAVNTKADDAVYKMKIDTNPRSVYLDISNASPGDSATAKLEVINSGNLDFHYSVSSRLEAGSPAMFEALRIRISDQGRKLFDGKLSELRNVYLGDLKKKERRTLDTEIELPWEGGNELQNAAVKYALDLMAFIAAQPSPSDPSDPASPDATPNSLPTVVPTAAPSSSPTTVPAAASNLPPTVVPGSSSPLPIVPAPDATPSPSPPVQPSVVPALAPAPEAAAENMPLPPPTPTAESPPPASPASASAGKPPPQPSALPPDTAMPWHIVLPAGIVLLFGFGCMLWRRRKRNGWRRA